MKILLKIITALALLACLTVCSWAEEARDVSSANLVTESHGFGKVGSLFDGNRTSGHKSGENASLTLEYPEGFGSAYLIFDTEYGPFTVTDEVSGETKTVGQESFLHTYLDLESLFGFCPQKLTFSFDNGPAPLLEISMFTRGQVPDWVQTWSAPVENGADLVLFSTHADDEQLFFAGILPYYAGELQYRVQVVYLTNHRNLSENPNLRCHEALNGLWAVGVRNYPVFGSFADYYSRSEKDSISLYQYMGVPQEELLGYVVENLRRFRPLVAVGHDLNGEYGHGAHMLYADLLTQAVAIAGDEEQFPESAESWGVWETPKLYLHLYEENQITMDWDRPLERFGGMTAFQVTKEKGFPCHESQYQDFAWYMSGVDRAADIPKYSPCLFGLYRSTVGPDVEKQDFFENLTDYAQQETQAEEQKRLEEERKRLEEERLAAEALARQQQTAPTTAPTTTQPPDVPGAQTPPKWTVALLLLVLLGSGTALVLICQRKK